MNVKTLHNVHILIVEDETFIAMDLVAAVEDAGGVAVGPASSVSQALALLRREHVDAAILDVNLADGHVGPVLKALRTKAVVVHTGVGLPAEVREEFPDVKVFNKPTLPDLLTSYLARTLDG